MRLPELAIRHPVTTLLAFATLTALGLLSLGRIGLELFPDVSYPTAAVFTAYPGVGPFEVESAVSRPIEEAVSSINGVKKVSSTSAEGLSLVLINFTWATDMSTVVSEIREKISGIESELPEGAERSLIVRFNPQVLPSLSFTVSSPIEGLDLRRLTEKSIVPEIERLPGVASASVSGGRQAAATVRLDLQAIGEKQIPILQILQAFKGENVNLPGGSLSLRDRYLTLRTIGEFASLQDIGEVLVGLREGVPVYLRDVAEIGMGFLPQEEFVRAGGARGVLVEVHKTQGANTVAMIRGVKEALRRLQGSLPPSVDIRIRTDQSVSILESIAGLADAAWQGGILAILVLLLFLRNLRSTFIIALAIPVSVVATFSLMYFTGMDLNIMSLAGLTLGVGMFVDNAIVVLEVIFRKQLAGLDGREAARLGAGEVAMAVTASTLTNIVVFLPLVFFTGFANIILRDLAYTLSFSMLVSLLMALTLVPVLCSRLLRLQKGTTIARRQLAGERIDLEISLADVQLNTGRRLIDAPAAAIQRAMRALDELYERCLGWAIRHAWAVIAIAVALLAGSLASIALLGMEFLPETDEGRLSIRVETKIESPFSRTEEKVEQIEEIVRSRLGADLVSLSSVIGKTGTGRLGETGSHLARVSITLVNKDARRRSIWTIIGELSQAIRTQVVDVRTTIGVEGLGALINLAAGSENPLVVEISGEDLDQSLAYAQRIAEIMRRTQGTRDVELSYQTGKPEIQFRVKRERALSLGLSPLEIAATIRAAYKGVTVSRYRRADDTYDVYVLLREQDRNSLSRLASLFLVNPRGTRIPIENVVDITGASGPVSIARSEKVRQITVTAALTGRRPLNKVMDEIRAGIAGLPPPPAGMHLALSGSRKQMLEAFRDLLFALLLGAGLVYVVMASQFESFLHPLIIMFCIPFALIGLTAALLLTATTFSIVAFIGAILLVGYVVNNGILLVDYINLLRRDGLPLAKAITIGGRTRLKPILMSVGTTILGLLPMALGLGTGAELRAPMARAVFGGLTSSTLITLILIPTIYFLIESRRLRRGQAGAA
jgi:HAE1 family hydrophobic/amphiphilic exporter-1